MSTLAYYENGDDENDKDKYKKLSGDINYLNYFIKQYHKEFLDLMSDVSDLKEDYNVNDSNEESYQLYKKIYVDLYSKFDDMRNYYDGSRE
jgi:hypothetical protein